MLAVMSVLAYNKETDYIYVGSCLVMSFIRTCALRPEPSNNYYNILKQHDKILCANGFCNKPIINNISKPH